MERHSLTKSIRLHLLPGLLVVAFYLLLAPVLNRNGYPSILALLLAAFIGIVPLQLGHLLYQGYRLNGKLSLKGIVISSQRMPGLKFAGLLIASLLVLVLIGGVSLFFEPKIKSVLFGWLPNWYFYDSNFQSYSKEALMTTAWVRLAFDGFVFPIIEELYFRGYLLHRLPDNTNGKLLVGALLFAIYHFWQPWNYVSLFLISLILVVPVVKFNNLYLSIAIHMIVNIIGSILFFGQLGQL